MKVEAFFFLFRGRVALANTWLEYVSFGLMDPDSAS
eukprot:09376.XXX_309867_309974_1 [CDS] Oithona nana genome sequencing.